MLHACVCLNCSMAALFITMTFLGTSNSSGVQPIVAIERPVFYRERAAGGYAYGHGMLVTTWQTSDHMAAATCMHSQHSYAQLAG